VNEARRKFESTSSSRQRSELTSIGEEDSPSFAPPQNWKWLRFGELANIVGGVTLGRKLDGRNLATFPYLRVANVQQGRLDLDVIKDIEIPIDELPKYRLEPGDVLLTEGGDWDKLGRSAIWRGEIENCLHQNHIFRARVFTQDIQSEWLTLFTNSPVGRTFFQNAAKQTTNLASINMTQLRNCPVPIPPLSEQKRIVSKVTELLSLCDALEAKLTQAESASTQLLSAAVHHLLNNRPTTESALCLTK
jgi:type I restriction enzyme S subunit